MLAREDARLLAREEARLPSSGERVLDDGASSGVGFSGLNSSTCEIFLGGLGDFSFVVSVKAKTGGTDKDVLCSWNK